DRLPRMIDQLGLRFEIDAHHDLGQKSYQDAHHAHHERHGHERRQGRLDHREILEQLQIEHIKQSDERHEEPQQAEAPKDVDRLAYIAIEKSDHEQVKNDFQDAAHAVVRVAVNPRVVPHRHLGYPSTVPGGVERNETMHLAVKANASDHSAAV